MNPNENSPHLSLGQALQNALGGENSGLTVGNLCSTVGDKGFGLVLMLLSLPSALPVPAPGYSTPFGIAIILVGLQLFRNQNSLYLPSKIKRLKLSPKLASKMLAAALKFLGATEHLIKPRWFWVNTAYGRTFLAIVVCIMAALMILPIPLTNTFPAMVVFLIGIGLSEDDGILVGISFIIGIFAVLLYAIVIYLVIDQGPEAIDTIKDWLSIKLGISG